MTFPHRTIAVFPGFVALPSGLHPAAISVVSPLVLKSVSPACRTKISSPIPSDMFGVFTVMATGLEKMRCSHSIPNSNAKGLIIPLSRRAHFFPRFIFSMIFRTAFSRFAGDISWRPIALGLIVFLFLSWMRVPHCRVVSILFFSIQTTMFLIRVTFWIEKSFIIASGASRLDLSGDSFVSVLVAT